MFAICQRVHRVRSIFIGLVSHKQSKFAYNQGHDGLANTLKVALVEKGLDVHVQINTSDEYSPSMLQIDGKIAWASVSETLKIEDQWGKYLRHGASQPSTALVNSFRSISRRLWAFIRYWRPWLSSDSTASPGISLVRRLLNIELSHVRLMREGIRLDTDWTLIIEDDASTLDLVDCRDGLLGIINASFGERGPAYVNISESFTPAQLGVDHLLTASSGSTWAGSASRVIALSSRPVTNTVCAILYRTTFLKDLLTYMDSLPLSPVVPIDWKLNAALMAMTADGRIGTGDCWTVTPGPIDQLSMR